MSELTGFFFLKGVETGVNIPVLLGLVPFNVCFFVRFAVSLVRGVCESDAAATVSPNIKNMIM